MDGFGNMSNEHDKVECLDLNKTELLEAIDTRQKYVRGVLFNYNQISSLRSAVIHLDKPISSYYSESRMLTQAFEYAQKLPDQDAKQYAVEVDGALAKSVLALNP